MQQRAAYAHSLTAGQTAQEYEALGKAADEISQLFAWLRRELMSSAAKLPATRQAGSKTMKGRVTV
jgi:hypothetical protein